MKKFCITIIAKLLPLMASAVSTTINGINYGLDSSTNMAEVVQGFYSGNIIIPSQVTYGGVTYAVTSIGFNAFSDCSGLTSVTIPNSVTNIDYYAFKGCSGLTSVTIPNSVTSIGGSAFSGCSGLTSITVPSSVTSIRSGAFSDTPWFNNLPNGLVYAGKVAYKYKGDMPKNTSIIIEDGTVAIGDNAFSGCSGLTSVTIPDGVTSIGAWGFEDCSSLTSVTIPDGVTSIGRSAFSGCSGLTSVTIPNSVTSIGNYAFYGCSGLPSITIPSSVTSIGDSAFWGFRGIFNIQDIAAWCKMSVVFPLVDATPRLYVNGKKIEHLVIPSSVESIGDGAFSGFSLASVTIPNSVTSIGRNAFSWCSGLTSVTIPSSVTSIGGFAFSCCSGLTSVTIPSSVTSIGNGAFSDTPWFNNQPNGLIYAGKVAYKYKGDMLNNTSIIIEDGTVEIAGSAFSGCSGLTSVTIPNSVNSICGSAFEDCSGLTTVISEIEKPFEIASSVFEGIPSYTELTVPKGTKAAYQATEGWNKFTKITEAEDSEFYVDGIYYIMGENNTVSVTSGEVKYSGDVVIPSQVTYNGYLYTVTSIGNDAFQRSPNLTSVTIPNSVIIIGEDVFYDCKALTSVNIPNGVTSIGRDAFMICTSLTSITIPNSVTSIEGGAFSGCSGLTTVISEIEKPFEIASSVFEGIPSYTELTVPKGTKAAYQAIEGWNKFTKITEAEVSGFYLDDIYYIIGENNTVSVTSGEVKYSGDVVIPSQVTYNGNSYTVTSINSVAFMDCTNLTSVTIPNSVKSIGSSAFWGCKGLTSVTIPNGVTSIESGVFYHCYGLTSVTIPNSVMSIGDYAFWECSITSLTIPNSVTSIGENAFGDGNLMNPIVSEIMNPFEISENTFNGINYVYSTLIVPPGTKLLYQSTAGWNKFKNIVEDNSDEANFAIDGVTYQGTKSEKMVVVESVDKSMVSLEIPASVRNDGTTYQVTGIADDAFKGSSMAALIWIVEAALPNNAFNNASIGSNFLLYVKSSTYAPSSVKNVVVNGTAQTIVLSDDGGQFYCPQAFTTRSISYTHNYSMETGGNGKGWETIALPFDVQKISHSTRGEIVPFPSYNSSSTQKPFWLANFSGSGFRRTAAVLANEPYIIAMPNSSSYRNEYNLAGDVTFSADNVQVPKTPTFSGTFVPAFGTVPQSSTVYALNVNNRNVRYSGSYDAGSRFIANLRDVRPFEAYISNSSTRGIIEISFDDGTTDMFDILLSTDESQEVTIHTLSGQQITRTSQRDFDAVWQQLPKGVYIINGKKWIK